MAVSRAEKETELGQLVAAFRETETAVLVDYRGVTVPQITDFRRQVRAAGAQYRVVKNTLAKKAVKDTPLSVLDAHFAGATGIVYTTKDPVAMAKTLAAFVKTAPSMTVKAAIVQGKAVAPAAVNDLATMPGKPELYVKLLFLLQAPAQRLVTVLAATPRNLVTVLNEAAKKKEATGN